MNAIHAERSIDTHEQLIHLIRKEMWKARIQWACIAVAGFAAVYFAGQFVR